MDVVGETPDPSQWWLPTVVGHFIIIIKAAPIVYVVYATGKQASIVTFVTT